MKNPIKRAIGWSILGLLILGFWAFIYLAGGWNGVIIILAILGASIVIVSLIHLALDLID